MELLVLDSNLNAVDIIDTFESLLWVERYCGYGEFELYTKATTHYISLLLPDRFLWLRDSNSVMVIENREVKYDTESGNKFIVTGRSFESLLDRRIVWDRIIASGNLQTAVQGLLNSNAILPTNPDRTIPKLIFTSSVDTAITSLTVDSQFHRENLYDVVHALCLSNNIGFRIVLTDDDLLSFSLYAGADRSYDQLANPYVIFSPGFENIITSDYKETTQGNKNVILVTGAPEEGYDHFAIVGAGIALARREMFSDASGMSLTDEEGTIPIPEYLAQLAQRGNEILANTNKIPAFEAEMDVTKTFKLGEDFFLGDIVQIVSEYGVDARARITEIIKSQSSTGVAFYPTFQILPEGV